MTWSTLHCDKQKFARSGGKEGSALAARSSCWSGLVSPGCSSLPYPTPIPPYALRGRQFRIACLLDCRPKGVKNAHILADPSFPAELPVQSLRFMPRQFGYAMNPKQGKIAPDSWSDGNKILKLPLFESSHRTISFGLLGHRASILLRTRSAIVIASEIAASNDGEGRPSQFASLRAARILAAISRTRFRPSSTKSSLAFSPFIRYTGASKK